MVARKKAAQADCLKPSRTCSERSTFLPFDVPADARIRPEIRAELEVAGKNLSAATILLIAAHAYATGATICDGPIPASTNASRGLKVENWLA